MPHIDFPHKLSEIIRIKKANSDISLRAACGFADINPQTIRNHRKQNPEVDQQIREAFGL